MKDISYTAIIIGTVIVFCVFIKGCTDATINQDRMIALSNCVEAGYEWVDNNCVKPK